MTQLVDVHLDCLEPKREDYFLIIYWKTVQNLKKMFAINIPKYFGLE